MNKRYILAIAGLLCLNATYAEETQQIIDLQAPHEQDSSEQLYTAITKNDLQLVKDLIAKGANVNGYFSSHFYITPLVAALNSFNFLIAQYLVKQGADVNQNVYGHTAEEAKTKGSSPLWIAVSYNEPTTRVKIQNERKLIKLLLDSGAKVDAKNQYGTVLQKAVGWDRYEIAKILLDYGAVADPIILQNAIINGSSRMVKLLLEHRAKPNMQIKEIKMVKTPTGYRERTQQTTAIEWIDKMIKKLNEQERKYPKIIDSYKQIEALL